ncbi:MAG TPA: protein-disulfide reductase DsbD domain-containing protein, partial [Allosphingosinicella sp.]|nr:protein-disulfide reductase DsbD domain-containing protein [Allosphingosinicella sp.]
MNRAGAFLLFLLASLFAATPAAAQGGRHMAVRLVPETAAAAPGSTITLAFTMRPAPGWHGYWRNPGDAGTEPRVQWRLPAGWRAGPLQYPVPDRLLISGLMNYVFERDYALLATVDVPAGAEPGATEPIDARLDYLVCTDQVCVPETATVTAELAVGEARNPSPLFQAFRQALPRPLGSEGRFALANGRLRIAIPLPAATTVGEPYFFPATPDALRYAEPQRISRNGDMLIVETAPGPAAAQLRALEGVLEIAPGTGLALTARPGAVPAAGTPIGTGAEPEAMPGEGPGILTALLLALLGGLVLNIMPCVFPILSLKALNLARAGEAEGTARREALAY